MKRRVWIGLVLAVALASVGCARVRHSFVDIPDPCRYLPWLPGCPDDPAGGGGGGAS